MATLGRELLRDLSPACARWRSWGCVSSVTSSACLLAELDEVPDWSPDAWHLMVGARAERPGEKFDAEVVAALLDELDARAGVPA